MYKHLIAVLLLLFSARADTPLQVNMATGDWNVDWANQDFFWFPDQGHDFEAKFYYHTVSGNTRVYNNYFTKNYGSADFGLDDAFNTYTTKDAQNRSTHWFVLIRYHYSNCTFDNAWVDYPDGFPQDCIHFCIWQRPPLNYWSGTGVTLFNNTYWVLWLVTYNAYYSHLMTTSLANGSTYTYPSDVSAWQSYGN